MDVVYFDWMECIGIVACSLLSLTNKYTNVIIYLYQSLHIVKVYYIPCTTVIAVIELSNKTYFFLCRVTPTMTLVSD